MAEGGDAIDAPIGGAAARPASTSVTGGRVIVALDFPGAAPALRLADRLDPGRCRVKVGGELFVRAGPSVIENLHDRGFEVFLDLKFHDIPNTVTGACRAAADLGVWMLNVHAAGGRRMMVAARGALSGRGATPILIAVTTLTSLTARDIREVGIREPTSRLVAKLANLACECGMNGVVCSARDLEPLAEIVPADFIRVTPGIRPQATSAHDQRRVTTPAQALANGADYLVIGRPITAVDDPLAALASIEREIGVDPVSSTKG